MAIVARKVPSWSVTPCAGVTKRPIFLSRLQLHRAEAVGLARADEFEGFSSAFTDRSQTSWVKNTTDKRRKRPRAPRRRLSQQRFGRVFQLRL
ncbi:unnamed protein product [Nippostrongylus brasiliensis]|uniref:Uncharacterized protein n=1 Tax=Nippostrongylus brasiliensis TaxID=27835 RepID=A0A0N4YRT1_NIPBR|nr:unnamed protein product [Nippostrongylus brasiliensis]